MLNDYKNYDLFGRTLLQKIDLKAPFHYDFPIAEQACFLYVLKGVFEYQRDDNRMSLAKDYALLLNCIQSGQQIQHCKTDDECQILIVTFYPDILKKVYERYIFYVKQIYSTASGWCVGDLPFFQCGFNEYAAKFYLSSE